MEGAGVLMGGVLAGLGMWILLPSGQPASGSARLTQLLAVSRRRFERLCSRAGSGSWAQDLSGISSWKTASDALSAALRERGVDLSRGASTVALLIGVAIVTIACLVLSSSPVGGLSGAVASLVAIPVWATSHERGVRCALAREMPDVFRSLAGSLGAGQTLAQSIEYVASHERGPAAPEFLKASLRLRCGISVAESLGELSTSLDAPGVGLLSSALLISQRTGAPLRGLFLRAATLVERQGEFEQELVVKTAQVRLSVRIVCSMPLVMICLLALISPDFQRGLASPVGIGSVTLAVCLDAVALTIIRRLMKGVV